MHTFDAAKASKRPTKSVKQEASGKASNKNRPTKAPNKKPAAVSRGGLRLAARLSPHAPPGRMAFNEQRFTLPFQPSC
jgi:hypothetical protein